MQKSISEILASAVNCVPISKENLAERLFQGIVKARSRFDESLQEVALSDDTITVEPSGLAVSFYVDYLRERATEFCQSDENAELLCRAFQMEEDALKQACALIIENFMPEKSMTPDMVLGIAGTLSGKGEHSVPSSKSSHMKKYLSDRVDEYITINSLMVAGSVFGLAGTDDERVEMDNQMIRIMRDALRLGIGHNQSGDPAPDPSQE
jgi:hypothetical protein